MPNDVVELCDVLKQAQIKRKFYANNIYKQRNMMAARIRQGLGWVAPAYDDSAEIGKDGERRESKEAKSIKARALDILDRHLAGKPQAPENQACAEALAVELEIVARGIAPYWAALDEIEDAMVKIAKALPVAPWRKTIKGFGEMGLAIIVAEAGDLSKYDTVSKLWKRLGLAPYNGKAGSTWGNSRWRNAEALTAQEWTGLGYKKQRRAEVFAFLGDNFSRHQCKSSAKSNTPFGRPKTKYGEVYVNRRMRTLESHPDWTPVHARKDALRVMSKAVIKDLWIEWRRQDGTLATAPYAEAAE